SRSENGLRDLGRQGLRSAHRESGRARLPPRRRLDEARKEAGARDQAPCHGGEGGRPGSGQGPHAGRRAPPAARPPRRVVRAATTAGLALLLVAGAPHAEEAAPHITFEATDVNAGDVIRGTDAVAVFTYHNTGTAPLHISEAKPACGCTV